MNNNKDNKERQRIINTLCEYLENTGLSEKKNISKKTYDKYPEYCQDKGGGMQIKISNIPSEFLLSLLEIGGEEQQLPFWETLKE